MELFPRALDEVDKVLILNVPAGVTAQLNEYGAAPPEAEAL